MSAVGRFQVHGFQNLKSFFIGRFAVKKTTVPKASDIRLHDELPSQPDFMPGIRRAPDRGFRLSKAQTCVALQNALRYIPENHHKNIDPRVPGRTSKPGDGSTDIGSGPKGRIKAQPIDAYKGQTVWPAKAFQLMIDNNLDFDVALYPYELVTYGRDRQRLSELDAVPPDQAIPRIPDRCTDAGSCNPATPWGCFNPVPRRPA